MSVDGKRPLRLLHTSDIHIGEEFDPARRLAELTAVVNAAIACQVHTLLIVGDLFDSTRVKSTDIEAALSQLARLTIPTIVMYIISDGVGSRVISWRVK